MFITSWKKKEKFHLISNFVYVESRKDDDTSTKTFVVGDLVWGPTKNCSSWPGKIVEVNDDNNVTVRWFGTEKYESKVDRRSLQTLTEGLDCQHQSRKKTRTWVCILATTFNVLTNHLTLLDNELSEIFSTWFFII